MKKLSLLLAILMIMSTMLVFASCDASDDVNGKDKEKTEENGKEAEEGKAEIAPKDVVIADMVAKIEESAPYAEYVDEILYKADDPDEMICWNYGVIDIKGYELLSDYVITMPSDYCQTLAIMKFDDGMTADDFEEVKTVITEEYIEGRASALQMYMPEEYEKMEWALANSDKIWRQYGDNLLVLAIYGGEEPTAVWDAIHAYLG